MLADPDVVVSRFADTPPMHELNVSNHLLGNRAALDAAWERDGYWFFRGVLDQDAVGRLRGRFLDVLDGLGVIDPTVRDVAVHNGASLEDYPIVMGGNPAEDPLIAVDPRDSFVNEPAIRSFFTDVFGDEPFWVPNTEYHAVPPRQKPRSPSRFNYVHADGPNNKGLPLKVVWIPLAPIDEETGGLAVAEGMHRPRMGDFERPAKGIAEQDVPVEAWRRTAYRPGDVLLFSLQLPHSGLANRSDKFFRLSMDIRGMRKSDHVPTVGNVVAIDRCAVMVETADGTRKTFRIDDDTFCRIWRGRQTGMPLTRDEIPVLVKVGDPVYLADDHGTVMFMRPQH